MRVYFDTNVLLDVLLNREPFVDSATQVWHLAEQGRIAGVVSALSLANIYYVARKVSGGARARAMVRDMLVFFEVANCGAREVDAALGLGEGDLEDALQYAVARSAAADCILTRDARGFPMSAILVLSPTEFVDPQRN